MAYLAFNAGGFFPGPPAYAAGLLSVALALRTLLAEDPFEGLGLRLAVAASALALYALDTLLSQRWSHAPGAALIEFDLPLLYLLALVLFGSMARRWRGLELLLRTLTLGIVVVCTCALATRLLPNVFPTSPNLANDRLSFPLTYWNALGLLAAVGLVLCLHFTSDTEERVSVRMLAAAAVPVQSCTLYFTFSRGGIAAAVVAVVVYVFLGRPRAVLSAAIATLPTSAIALGFAYHANLLATTNPTTPAAVSQGHRVAIVLAACVIAAAVSRRALVPLDRRTERLTMPALIRRHARVVWVSGALAVAIAATALHSTIVRDWQRFINPAATTSQADFRSRLTDPANNGRIYTWRVALHGFESALLLGHGAGTYADTWAQNRPAGFFVQDAHSLYLEVLDELGLVGFVLLLVAIFVVLVTAARRVRGSRRALYAAVFAVLLAWALHAGVDWDWEMPALSIIFFALGGAVLARPPKAGTGRVDPPPLEELVFGHRRLTATRRLLLAISCLLLAVVPAYVWLAQRKINAATAAFNGGKCDAAASYALSSISIVSVDPKPYEVLAYCDIRRDMPNAALVAINKAVSLDPNDYVYTLDLAVIQAAAGENPLAATRRAVYLNPLDEVVQEVWQSFGTDRPSQWQSDGRQFVSSFTNL